MSILAFSQTFVDTSVQRKKAVIEQYTGGKAIFDPAGHKIADDIKYANPDSVTVINIHTGSYASPGLINGTYSLPDYRTSFGSAIYSLSGATAFPMASVNRAEFAGFTTSGNTYLGRNNYDTACKKIFTETSPINIGLRTTYNEQIKELSIKVEIYFTDTVTDSLFINVGIKQNKVIGPHNGDTSRYPEKYGANIGIYEHNNMLRDLITGQWGEYLDSISYSKGTFWTETFIWTVPDSIVDVPVVFTNLDVFAFVTEKKEPILTGTSIHADPGMSGVYTIGGASPDYNDFTEAVTALKTRGVAGNVTFNVRSGTYNEQIEIDSIAGVSDSSTVTLQSDPSNASLPLLTYSSSNSLKNYTVKFNGSDHITFKGLKISATGSQANTLLFAGRTEYITVDSCYIEGRQNLTGNQYTTVKFLDGTGDNASNCTISNSTIKYGYYGIQLKAPSAEKGKSNVISHNKIDGFLLRGIELYYQDSVDVVSNEIFSLNTSSWVQSGVVSFFGGPGSMFEGNKIQLQTTKNSFGIQFVSTSGNATDKIGIINNSYVNLVSPVTSANDRGIQLSSCNYMDILYNTMLIRSTDTSNGTSFQSLGGTDLTIKNNNFINTGAGVAMSTGGTLTNWEVDYNNYYTTGNTPFYKGSSPYATLSSWVAATFVDSNSTEVNPNFIADTLLKPNNNSLNNLGTVIPGVTEDIEGTTRHATTPDIGAYEFTGVKPPMAGIYTIGGTTPNYPTIDSAVNDLNTRGVQDTVVFHIRQGTYNEQISIDSIAGSSALNIIVFQADPSNTSEVIVRETSINHYLTRVSSLTFKNIAFTAGTGNERSFEFLGHNEDVSFLNCSFEGVGIYLLSGASKYLDGLTVDSCEFSELYYGVRILNGKKGLIRNSKFECAIAVHLGMDSSEVHDNTMRCFVGHTDASGVSISGNVHEVYNNDIVCQTLDKAYGVHTDFANNVQIYNNSISLLNNNPSPTLGYLRGIRHFGSSSIRIHHNAIYLRHYSSEAYQNYGIRLSNISDSSFSNNHIVLECHGTAIEYTGSLGNFSSDFNNYVLLEGDTILNDNFTNHYTSLSSLRSIGLDSNSVSVNPYFLSDTLLKPYRLKVNDKGAYMTDYPVDFDSITRGISNTDIGAYQYNPIEYDVVLDSIQLDTLCAGVQSVKVLVKNVADSLVQTISLSLEIDTSNTGFVSHGSQEFSVNLNNGDSVWVTYTNIELVDSTQYSFALSIDTINGYLDNIPEDNKDTISFWTFPNPTANFVEGDGCANDTITLTADSGSVHYYWEGPSSYLDTGRTVNRVAATGASGFYVLTVIDSNFCTDSIHQIVELDTVPQFSLPGDTSFCDGLTYDIQALVDPHLDYKWSNGDSASKITVNTSGVYRLTVTNQHECSAQDSIQVTVFALPMITLAPFDSLCQYDDTLVFTEGMPSGGFYSGINVFDDSLYNPLQSGVFPITYTFVDANNCQNSATQNIVVHKLPNVLLPTMPSVCENVDTLQLTGNAPQGGVFSGEAVFDTIQGLMAPNLLSADSSVVYYRYTDQNGCSSGDSSIVYLDSVTTVSLTGFSNLCANESVLFSQGTPKGGSYSGYGMVNDTVFDANSVLPDSTYRITYTFENAFGCIDTASETVFVDTLPNVSYSPPVQEYCVDFGSDTLRGGTPLGGYYFGNGVSNDSLFALDSAGLHEVFYTVENSNGCWDTASALIRIYDLPNVSLQLPTKDTQLCVDRSTFKLFGGVPANGLYEGAGVSLGRFHPSTAGVGVHSISYTYTDANSCTSSDTAEVIVDSIPELSITVPQSDVCVNDAQFVMNWGAPVGGIYSGVGMISDSVFDPNSSGVRKSVSIEYAYTDGNGCRGVVYDTLNVDSLTPITFGFISDYCENALLDTLRTGSILQGDFSYFSQKGAIVDDSVYDASIAGLGTDIISYRFKNLLGCADTLSQSIEVLAPPTVTWGLNDTLCANGSIQTLSGGNPLGGTYFSSSAIVNGNYDPSLASLGVDTVKYAYTDTIGCADTAIGFIRVDSVPVVQFVSGDTFCLNEGIQSLNLGTPTGGSYTGTGMATGSSFDPLLANVGAHTLTYSYTDGNGCTDTKQNVVKVNPLPNASLQALSNVCLDKAAFNLPKGSPLGVNHYFIGAGISDTLSGTFDPAIAGVGSHTIQYVVESSLGCVDTAVQTQVVDSIPIVSLSSFNPVCEDSSAFTLSGGFPSSGGTGQYSGSGVLGGVFFPNLAQKGTNVITYSFTNQKGCISSDTAHLIVNRQPSVTPALFNDLCHSQDSVTLSGALPAGGVYSGVNVGGGQRFSQDSVGTFIITYEYTDGNGCSAETQQPITVHAKPFVSLNSLPNTCENGSSFRLSGGLPFGGVYSGNAVVNGSYIPSMASSLVDTVWYAYTDLNQCTDSVYQILNLDSATEVSILPFKLICENDGPIDLTSLVSPIGGAFQGAGVVNSTYLPSLLDTGNNLITYSFTNGLGCKTDTVIDGSIYPNPTIDMFNDTAICYGDQAVIGVKQGYSFEWDIGSFDRTVDVSPESSTTYNVTVTNSFNCSSLGQIEVEVNPAITLFTNSRESECGSSTGVLGVTHIGGQTPFNYLWSTGDKSDKVFDVASGIYEVTVTDANGCKEVANIAVSDADVQQSLVISNITDVRCPGDANGKVVLGNASNFEHIIWSSGHVNLDSLTGLNGGEYIALATTENGCKSAVSALVNESSAIFGAIESKVEPSCGNNDGALNLKVTGGTDPLQFTWNTGQNSQNLSSIPAGAYQLYIEDAQQCKDTLVFALGSSKDVNVLVDSISQPTCGMADGAIYASIFGEVDTVIWSTMDTGLSVIGVGKGTYWVSVSDTNGCASVRWIDVDSKTMQAPTLCIATYDTTHQGFISLYDTNSVYDNVQWTHEVLMASTWVSRLGTVNNDTIVDTTLTQLGLAHPRRLVAIDTCGGKKQYSNSQRPIFLRTDKSDDRISLRWNAYEGRSVSQYDIWRQTDNGWEKIDSISPLLTNFVDYAIPEKQRTLRYRVVAQLIDVCSNVHYMESFSNPSTDYGDKYLSENEKLIETNQLHLYPNPNDGSFSLDVSELNGYQGAIEIIDQKGLVVYRTQFDENHQSHVTVNMTESATGIYILKVMSQHRLYSKKFVIQH